MVYVSVQLLKTRHLAAARLCNARAAHYRYLGALCERAADADGASVYAELAEAQRAFAVVELTMADTLKEGE